MINIDFGSKAIVMLHIPNAREIWGIDLSIVFHLKPHALDRENELMRKTQVYTMIMRVNRYISFEQKSTDLVHLT